MNTLFQTKQIMGARANTAFNGFIISSSLKYKGDNTCHLVIVKRENATWENKPFLVSNYNASCNCFSDSTYDLTLSQACELYNKTLDCLGISSLAR